MEKLDFNKFKDSDFFDESSYSKKKRKIRARRKKLSNIKKWMPSKKKRIKYYKENLLTTPSPSE